MFLLPFVQVFPAHAYKGNYIKNQLVHLALGVPGVYLVCDYKPSRLMLGATMSTNNYVSATCEAQQPLRWQSKRREDCVMILKYGSKFFDVPSIKKLSLCPFP